MCFSIQSIVQTGFLLIFTIFLFWLSMIGILYQNKKCSLLKIKKSFYNETFAEIDSRLKLNHFTILGTHNSYHEASLINKYSHPPLNNQLSFGIRQIELDIHLMKENHLVYHLQLFDDKTNCYCLKECLMIVSRWLEDNRFRFPIYLFIEIKQMFYEDLVTGLTGGVKCEHFGQIKEQILEIFDLNTFILPQQVQGNKKSIKQALKRQREKEQEGDYTYNNYGWPPVYQSLGKLIPVFIDDMQNIVVDLYSTCDAISSFFFIAQKNINLPYASIMSLSSSVKDQQILRNSTRHGFIARILLAYGDNNLLHAYQLTKKFGVHIISSDSVQCDDTPLCQALANDFQNSTILCNNYSSPPFCNSTILGF